MNDNNNISLSYESLWKFIIRPPRDNYSLDELGYPNFVYKSKNYYRKDLELISSQGYKMKCSLIEPEPKSRPSKMMPIVIYLHGNASSRLEGLRSLEILLPHGINLFLVDLPGSGLSEGEYISLGYYESHDLGIIDQWGQLLLLYIHIKIQELKRYVSIRPLLISVDYQKN